MNLRKGNYMKLVVGPILDYNKVVVTNLAGAPAVRFMLKIYQDDPDISAVLTKTLSSGITVNDPIVGSITIVINSADTELLTVQTYYMALQIEYSATNIQEVYIKENKKTIDTIDLVQDTIRKP